MNEINASETERGRRKFGTCKDCKHWQDTNPKTGNGYGRMKFMFETADLGKCEKFNLWKLSNETCQENEDTARQLELF